MRYVVTIYDCFEGDMQSKLVSADSWREALREVDQEKASYLPGGLNLRDAQDHAADQDWLFTVVEVG